MPISTDNCFCFGARVVLNAPYLTVDRDGHELRNGTHGIYVGDDAEGAPRIVFEGTDAVVTVPERWVLPRTDPVVVLLDHPSGKVPLPSGGHLRNDSKGTVVVDFEADTLVPVRFKHVPYVVHVFGGHLRRFVDTPPPEEVVALREGLDALDCFAMWGPNHLQYFDLRHPCDENVRFIALRDGTLTYTLTGAHRSVPLTPETVPAVVAELTGHLYSRSSTPED